jgi:hypothetical protein
LTGIVVEGLEKAVPITQPILLPDFIRNHSSFFAFVKASKILTF